MRVKHTTHNKMEDFSNYIVQKDIDSNGNGGGIRPPSTLTS